MYNIMMFKLDIFEFYQIISLSTVGFLLFAKNSTQVTLGICSYIE
jgi:hypothetical protein